MTATRTYLDYNATAPMRPQARDQMISALACLGNPSSVHAEGREARALIEQARDDVAALVGADPGGVVFTSSGTEACNMVLQGMWDTIYVAGIEHPAVLKPAYASGADIVELPVGADGVVDLDAFAELAGQDRAAPDTDVPPVATGKPKKPTALLALQLANNETGVLQDVARAVEIAHANGIAVLCDCVQAAGKCEVDAATLGADYFVISGHKIGAPKGVGALLADSNAPLNPLILGGGQEKNRRGGTENVAAISAFGAAAVAARAQLDQFAKLAALRDRIERELAAVTPGVTFPGAEVDRLPNTTTICTSGRRAETLVIALDLAGLAVSAGSACSSGKTHTSNVLEAMGLPQETATSAIRVSLGWSTTENDIDIFLNAWKDVVANTTAVRQVA